MHKAGMLKFAQGFQSICLLYLFMHCPECLTLCSVIFLLALWGHMATKIIKTLTTKLSRPLPNRVFTRVFTRVQGAIVVKFLGCQITPMPLLPNHVMKYSNGHKSPKKQGFDARLNLPNVAIFSPYPHLLEVT
jgi:hypothetical protein